MGNPVRKIPHRTRGVRGYFYSIKNGRRVDYESLNEQCLMKVLETNPEIESYCEQPLKLEFEWNGRTYPYTPDLFSTDIYSQSILYEVKPEEAIKKDDGRLQAKFEVAREYCSGRGWKFAIVTDAIRNSKEFQRADFLWPHLMNPGADMNRAEELLQSVRQSTYFKMQDISGSLSWANPDYCLLLYLVARGKLVETPYGQFEEDTVLQVFGNNG